MGRDLILIVCRESLRPELEADLSGMLTLVDRNAMSRLSFKWMKNELLKGTIFQGEETWLATFSTPLQSGWTVTRGASPSKCLDPSRARSGCQCLLLIHPPSEWRAEPRSACATKASEAAWSKIWELLKGGRQRLGMWSSSDGCLQNRQRLREV